MIIDSDEMVLQKAGVRSKHNVGWSRLAKAKGGYRGGMPPLRWNQRGQEPFWRHRCRISGNMETTWSSRCSLPKLEIKKCRYDTSSYRRGIWHCYYTSCWHPTAKQSGKRTLRQSKYDQSKLFCFHDWPNTLQPWTLTVGPLQIVSMLYDLWFWLNDFPDILQPRKVSISRSL